MIDSNTDQILLQELKLRNRSEFRPNEERIAVIANNKFEGVTKMFGRCASSWRGGFGAQFMGGGFPWGGRGGRWGRFFGPGEIRLALLSMLESGPKHGYELMKELESKSAGIYKASAGAIYPALQQLEDDKRMAKEFYTGFERVVILNGLVTSTAFAAALSGVSALYLFTQALAAIGESTAAAVGIFDKSLNYVVSALTG